MMSTEGFNLDWARDKLKPSRRRNELKQYIQQYLPELGQVPLGLVVDIGCGPGDFLDMCREMGYRVLGIDAENGENGMGDAYLELSKKYCDEFGVPVYRCGLDEVLLNPDDWPVGDIVCLNSRGSIEQALSHCMEGEPHHLHHRADKLDWMEESSKPWLNLLFQWASQRLVSGGVFLIHANGTKSTDELYDRMVKQIAQWHGLELAYSEPPRLHKWRKV